MAIFEKKREVSGENPSDLVQFGLWVTNELLLLLFFFLLLHPILILSDES